MPYEQRLFKEEQVYDGKPPNMWYKFKSLFMLLFLFKRAVIIYQEPMTWSGVACEQALHLDTSGSREKSRESSTRKETRKRGVIFFVLSVFNLTPDPLFDHARARARWLKLTQLQSWVMRYRIYFLQNCKKCDYIVLCCNELKLILK